MNRSLPIQLVCAGLLLMAPAVMPAQDTRGPVSRPGATALWRHINTTADLGELRNMTGQWDAGGGVLQLMTTKSGTYAWAVVPAPKAGWDLMHHATVEAEITNISSRPVEMMLWVVGDRGWDAVPASASPILKTSSPAHHDVKISPGELRLIQTWLDGGVRVLAPTHPMVLRAVATTLPRQRGCRWVSGASPPNSTLEWRAAGD